MNIGDQWRMSILNLAGHFRQEIRIKGAHGWIQLQGMFCSYEMYLFTRFLPIVTSSRYFINVSIKRWKSLFPDWSGRRIIDRGEEGSEGQEDSASQAKTGRESREEEIVRSEGCWGKINRKLVCALYFVSLKSLTQLYACHFIFSLREAYYYCLSYLIILLDTFAGRGSSQKGRRGCSNRC